MIFNANEVIRRTKEAKKEDVPGYPDRDWHDGPFLNKTTIIKAIIFFLLLFSFFFVTHAECFEKEMRFFLSMLTGLVTMLWLAMFILFAVAKRITPTIMGFGTIRAPKHSEDEGGEVKKSALLLAMIFIFLSGTVSCSSANKPLPATSNNSSVALMKFDNGFRTIESSDGWKIQQIEVKRLGETWEEFASRFKPGESVQINVLRISSNGDVGFSFIDPRDEELFKILEEGE